MYISYFYICVNIVLVYVCRTRCKWIIQFVETFRMNLGSCTVCREAITEMITY